MTNRSFAPAALIAALTWPAVAAAQDAHYWTYGYGPIGQLTEGTVVGGVSDLSAVYYNPAACALMDEPRFVLTLNSIELANIDVPGAAGEGLNFDQMIFDVVPAMVAGHVGQHDSQPNHFAFASDGFNLVFNIMALFWSALMIADAKDCIGKAHHFDPPIVAISALPLALFSFKVAKLVYLYRTCVSASIGQTIAAAWAGLALTHTISIAMLTGFVTKERPFIRTPNMAHGHTLLSALIAARTELFFAIIMLGAAWWVPVSQMEATRSHLPQTQAFDIFLWSLVLVIQSIPHVAAVGLSLL